MSRRTLLISLIVALFALTNTAHAKDKTRKTIHPRFHGVWMVQMVSHDKGRTLTPIKEKFILCRVFSKTIKMRDGEPIKVLKVITTKDNKGNPANMAMLDSGVVWTMTKFKVGGSPMVLLQVMDFPSLKETLRFMVKIWRKKKR